MGDDRATNWLGRGIAGGLRLYADWVAQRGGQLTEQERADLEYLHWYVGRLLGIDSREIRPATPRWPVKG